MENINLNIPKEKFRFADPNRKTGDKKFDTKQMSYAKDVFRRFCKNKSSVVAAIIICLLVAFAILVPMVAKTTYSESLTDIKNMQYVKLLPKNPLFEGTGFWDGTKKEIINQNRYNIIGALEKETGETVITKVIKDAYQETSTVANKEIITTAITNLDIHDIARVASTFGVAGYFLVHPELEQKTLAKEIIDFWGNRCERGKIY